MKNVGGISVPQLGHLETLLESKSFSSEEIEIRPITKRQGNTSELISGKGSKKDFAVNSQINPIYEPVDSEYFVSST